jgi:hypothetical protein
MWAEEEFGRAELGDPRRTKRLIEIAVARALKPSVSLPQCFEERTKLEAMYDFCDNEHVKREKIMESHRKATTERIKKESVVLAVQDTTYVDYTHHPQTTGLGILSDKNHQGMLLHTTLAVTPEREPLGLIDQQIIYRDPGEYGKSEERKKRPIEEKESYKWLESLERTAEVQKECAETKIVSVGDRESDIYDLFQCSQTLKQDILVRGAWNRLVDHEEKYLFNYLENQEVSGEITLEIPKQGTREARQAKLTVRHAEVKLKPPAYRGSEHLPLIEVSAVLAQEQATPNGVKAIDWLLLTTVKVENFANACERLEWYRTRWIIEIYHKVLKSGCQIENRQFETASRLERYLAIDSVVAWRILGLTFQSRETPDISCEAFLERAEWQALFCYIHKTQKPPKKPPTLKEAAQWIAKLGGFLGRKCDGHPGVTVMWRGFQRLSDLVSFWLVLNPSCNMAISS